jgi:hypothetical protein
MEEPMTADADDAHVADALTELRAWSDGLADYDVDAGLARHEQLLATGGAAAPVRVAGRGWWIAGATAVVLVGLGVAAVPTRDAGVEPLAPALAPVRVLAEPIAVPVAVGPASPAAPVMPTGAEVEPSPRPRAAKSRAPARASASALAEPAADVGADVDALERELVLVKRMRALLADDPAAVLRVAIEADREIGRGVLTEERAALRVFALARTGDARAERAAADFLRDYGDGPFAARVARLGREGPEAEVH